MLPAPARAVLAGALHGALEWLPVSSSGHIGLLAHRAGWPESQPGGERALRTLEVGLHTGSLLPLSARVRTDLAGAPPRAVAAALLSTTVTSAIGAAAGPVIERRATGPRAVAVGLLAGSALLLAAERARARDGGRPLGEVTLADGLLIGLAQGAALWPGTSRRATTLAAGWARGLSPEAADAFSWATGLTTVAGATVWQGWRDREELASGASTALAGAAASAASGYLTASLPARTRRWPASVWAAWRSALAAAVARG